MSNLQPKQRQQEMLFPGYQDGHSFMKAMRGET